MLGKSFISTVSSTGVENIREGSNSPDITTLSRRFPKTYKMSLSPAQSLVEVEKTAYKYLTLNQIELFNAVKDSKNESILAMLNSKQIQYDDLFCIDQCEMIILFELMIQNCSLEVRDMVFERVITTQHSKSFDRLLWAIRSHLCLEKVRSLYLIVCQDLNDLESTLGKENMFSGANKYAPFYKGVADLENTSYQRTPLLEASLYEYYDAVFYLVSQGEDVNEFDFNGQTPLMEVCRWGQLKIVDLLLQTGARTSVNRPNRFKQYPLGEAIRWDYLDIALSLIQNFADITLINPDLQNKFLVLQQSTGEPIKLEILIQILEIYLAKKHLEGGVFAIQSLLKFLKSHQLNDFNDVERFKPILSRKEYLVFYQLSQPYLDEFRVQSIQACENLHTNKM